MEYSSITPSEYSHTKYVFTIKIGNFLGDEPYWSRDGLWTTRKKCSDIQSGCKFSEVSWHSSTRVSKSRIQRGTIEQHNNF